MIPHSPNPPPTPTPSLPPALPPPAADVAAAVHSVLPIAVGMLPINAAVYVLDGVVTGAADFSFMVRCGAVQCSRVWGWSG